MRKIWTQKPPGGKTLSICIQDPTDPASPFLIDSLREAMSGATRGGGAYAFLSTGGVKLLLRDDRFLEFAENSPFDLVVGADAITDVAAVVELEKVRKLRPRLSAAIHLPQTSKGIFHPKFAWFENSKGGVLLTGSGNLTGGGLRWNFEAFTVSELSKTQLADVVKRWDAFKARNAGSLFPPMSENVASVLKRNADWKAAQKSGAVPPSPGTTAGDVDEVPAADTESDVLVVEVPKSGDRWKQVNFDLHTFTGFFGASTTTPRTVYFFHARSDGTLGPKEVRPAVTVASHNYRFELEAASGLAYPSAGRPICVFLKMPARTFFYTLSMPGGSEHPQLLKLLDAAQPATPGRLRRVLFKAADVQAQLPGSPLWKQLTI